MDKQKLLNKFAKLIEQDLEILIQAAKVAHEAATHSESKAEDQYDTRGLEASYLAGAQAERSAALQSDLRTFQTLPLQNFRKGDRIAASALVTLEDEEGAHCYLLMPCAGGRVLNFNGKRIQVITPKSPIGEAILGRTVGDQVTLVLQNKTRDYDIVSVE